MSVENSVQMHQNEQIYLECGGLIIDGLKLNSLITRLIILIETISTDSMCFYAIYFVLYGTWDKVVVHTTIKIILKC